MSYFCPLKVSHLGSAAGARDSMGRGAPGSAGRRQKTVYRRNRRDSPPPPIPVGRGAIGRRGRELHRQFIENELRDSPRPSRPQEIVAHCTCNYNPPLSNYAPFNLSLLVGWLGRKSDRQDAECRFINVGRSSDLIKKRNTCI